MPRSRLSAVAVAALAFAVAAGGAARAQAPQEPDDDVEPEVAAAPVQPMFFIDDSNFDQWVFGNGLNASTGRGKIEAQLKTQVERVERDYTLTDAQKKKLELAGRGDIKRLFDRVEEKRRAFQLVRTDQQKYVAFYNKEIQPLQQMFQNGAFGDGSFFAKSLRKTLDTTQAAHYEASTRERDKFRFEARLRLVLAAIDGAAGLTADQRELLWRILRAETRPPKKFSGSDYYVVMIQVARLPEAKIKPIFTEAQWRQLGPQFANAQRMEPTLAELDVLPDAPARDAKTQ